MAKIIAVHFDKSMATQVSESPARFDVYSGLNYDAIIASHIFFL